MVTVDKLKIHGFGRFKDKEFDLAPGLNLVFGGNEAGKSTIHSFIEAMLFGFWQPHRSGPTREEGWEKYRPWQGERYGGELTYSWSEGKVRVARDFNEDSVRLLDLTNQRELTDLPQNSWGEPDYARLHFGCTKLVFRNTISISQLGSATDSAVALEVRNFLSNLAQSGGSGISVERALTRLAQLQRETELELTKTQSAVEEKKQSWAAAKDQVAQATKLEIEQYQATDQLERLQALRRHLKELAQQMEAQAALGKLERLSKLRNQKETIDRELVTLSSRPMPSAIFEQWQQLQAEKTKAQELHQVHAENLEEVVERRQGLEKVIADLAPYAKFDKDTLIEMSSAWQMQTKGQQVIDDLQSQLESIGTEIRQLTTELAKLPYFRPDTLDRAAVLQAQARGVAEQGTLDELGEELDQRERALERLKALRWSLVFPMLGAGAAGYLLNPLWGLGIIPILFSYILLNSSVKKSNLSCRKLRRSIYSAEVELLNGQRQREQAQRELGTIFSHSQVDSMKELEQKYHTFEHLSQRKDALLREQKYLTEKMENYSQETQVKARELQEILDLVNLSDASLEDALASFRNNLDKLLDTRLTLEQCQDQEKTARQRWEQSQGELDQVEKRSQEILSSLGLDTPDQVKVLAAEHARRQDLAQQAQGLEQRMADLLEGISEAQLREQAAAASDTGEIQDSQDLPQRLEELEQQILDIQAKKSEGMGRLEGMYADMPAPADLEEELEVLKAQTAQLQQSIRALDLAATTIAQLAEELNKQLAPELNQMVSSLVQRITGGKYRDLQVAKDMSISVTTPEEQAQVDIGRLSGGTIDQFYFACRVAIADMITGGGLPLFLDDSFVQYDDQRLQHMLRLLVELGNTRQIILLTCQEREVKELSSVASGSYQLINLEN